MSAEKPLQFVRILVPQSRENRIVFPAGPLPREFRARLRAQFPEKVDHQRNQSVKERVPRQPQEFRMKFAVEFQATVVLRRAVEFRRERLSVEDIVSLWAPVLKRLGDRHFILTVSPIRHLKDGLHGNQLSKATLLLAEDILVRTCPNAEYFPSYEIIIDELRDRTWFEADGAHPTQAAVDIVWDRFKNAAQIL